MRLKGKVFLVTGGAGFIGSHLVDMLLEEDVRKVIVLDNFIRGGSHNLKNALNDDRFELFGLKGDITSIDEVISATNNIDAVFHLASLSLPHCQKYPRSALNVNVNGTFNLLESCIKNNIKRIVYASSSSVYGNAKYTPMDENHPFNFRDIYAATKLAGESFLQAFHYKYGLDYAALRFMNIYGPRLDYSGAYVAIIMKIIDRLENNLPPKIFGDGSQSFDFVFVKDACRSLLMAMESSKSCETYNISSGKKISILDICNKIQKLMKKNIPIDFIKKNSDKTLVTNRVGSTEKAKNELGFKTSISLENGLKQVIDWKLNHTLSNK